ncbi:MAG: cupin domain-containing protein [Desulfatiglandaceae bacterium]|jgi:quercetin dioxygenase-like cupin family protein
MTSEKIGGWEVTKEKKAATEEMRDSIINESKDLEWKPHPANENVSLAFVVSKRDDNVDGTCLFARVPKGEGLPEHTHDANDIIVPLSGKGKLWINGLGEFEVKKGVVFNIPPGVSHRLFDVTEELEIFDVFIGPIL